MRPTSGEISPKARNVKKTPSAITSKTSAHTPQNARMPKVRRGIETHRLLVDSDLIDASRAGLETSYRAWSSAQRRSLFDSMSNHMAKSVNCDPKINNSATSTTVPTDTALPMSRRTTSAMPSPRPSSVIRKPNA